VARRSQGDQHGRPLVLHVIPAPRGRGAQRAARELVDGLNDRAGRSPAGSARLRHELLALFAGPPEVAVDRTLEHRGRGGTSTGLSLALVAKLARTLHECDPSAVVAHGGDALKPLAAATLGRHRPLVYCAIGTYGGSVHGWQGALWRALLRRCDRIVAVGDEVLDECVNRLGADPVATSLIPNGRDPAVFHPREAATGATGEPVVGFVGALTTQKQPDRFLEVVEALRSRQCRFRAMLVGDGPLRAALEPRARAAGVDVLGQRDDVDAVLRDIDVLVFPSKPTGEGMPGVLIEAGLSGIPVVATAVPGVHAVVVDGETGLVVPDDARSLTDAVASLLDGPERRKALGTAAACRCRRHFTTAAMVEQWDDLLHELVEAGQASRPR
jgi:glycosyltransferase involved in cell wall biosynthesis